VKALASKASADIEKAEPLVKRLPDLISTAKSNAAKTPDDQCAADTLALYQQIEHSRPRSRLSELATVKASIAAVGDALAPLTNSGAWVEDDSGALTHYLVTTIEPTLREVRVIEIKAAPLKYDAGLAGFAVSTKSGASVKFTVMRAAAWYPEIGAGLIFADFREPKYGTGTNAAGTTVVKLVGQDSVSLDPALVANFLVRQEGNVLPMVQLGAVPSPNSPGFLVGVGFRFVRPRIGFGVEWAHLWIKDLVGLEPNDPVTGTEQIESSLKREGRDNPYFMIQYSF
jgi:hypothetical protein